MGCGRRIFEPARLPRALPGGPDAAPLGVSPHPRWLPYARARFGVLARTPPGISAEYRWTAARVEDASVASREHVAPRCTRPLQYRQRRAVDRSRGNCSDCERDGLGVTGKALPAVPAAPPVPPPQPGRCGVLVVAPFGLRTFERCSVATAGVGAAGLPGLGPGVAPVDRHALIDEPIIDAAAVLGDLRQVQAGERDLPGRA